MGVVFLAQENRDTVALANHRCDEAVVHLSDSGSAFASSRFSNFRGRPLPVSTHRVALSCRKVGFGRGQTQEKGFSPASLACDPIAVPIQWRARSVRCGTSVSRALR